MNTRLDRIEERQIIADEKIEKILLLFGERLTLVEKNIAVATAVGRIVIRLIMSVATVIGFFGTEFGGRIAGWLLHLVRPTADLHK